MTDLARAIGARAEVLAVRKDSAWSSFGNVKPSRPSPPTLSACRREKVVAWNPAQANECFGGVILALAAFVLQINDGLKPKSIRPFSTRNRSQGTGNATVSVAPVGVSPTDSGSHSARALVNRCHTWLMLIIRRQGYPIDSTYPKR